MRIKSLLINPQTKFVFVTFLTNFIGLLKSIFFLKYFNFEILGLISLAQTFSSSISLMQFGVVTGGYRIFSYKKNHILEKINSTVLVFFILLSIILITFGFILSSIFIQLDTKIVISYIIIGILSLYSNWVINKLLGTKNIKTVNIVQTMSAFVSLFMAFLAIWFGFAAVVFSMFLQPVILIFLTYLLKPNLIPKYNFKIYRKFIMKLVSLGFIPYLTTALAVFNSQLARWIITLTLGTVILGKTFLPILFVTLVSVFPAAISNLYYPKMIEKFEGKKMKEFNALITKEFYILLFYYMIVILGITFFLKIVLQIAIPDHINSVIYIYAILPSVFFMHLSIPLITYFNAAKMFRNILFGGIISTLSYVVFLIIYTIFFEVNLLLFFTLESISAFIFFLYNIHVFKTTYSRVYPVN